MHSTLLLIWQCIMATAFSFLSRSILLFFQLIHLKDYMQWNRFTWFEANKGKLKAN